MSFHFTPRIYTSSVSSSAILVLALLKVSILSYDLKSINSIANTSNTKLIKSNKIGTTSVSATIAVKTIKKKIPFKIKAIESLNPSKIKLLIELFSKQLNISKLWIKPGTAISNNRNVIKKKTKSYQ